MLLARQPDTLSDTDEAEMADVEKGKKHEEPEEYVPAEYVAADAADEQVMRIVNQS